MDQHPRAAIEELPRDFETDTATGTGHHHIHAFEQGRMIHRLPFLPLEKPRWRIQQWIATVVSAIAASKIESATNRRF
ncbi:hypothetical protein [Sinorhizobium fredii]|uniref:hypothetical protein n=1 Tax=Rhizobium fredii TaxID=380 RepID=UPI000B16D933|nr:hypothetical protein [Sinorhizobium fredii]